MNLKSINRLNKEQEQILMFLEKFQACEAKQIALIFDISINSAINRMKTLERKGYVISFKKITELNTCYKLSKKGKEITNPWNLNVFQPTNGTIKHYVLIASLATYLMSKGAKLNDLISERELLKQDIKEHRPDLLLKNKRKTTAFEVELTAKDNKRLINNILTNHRNYDIQIWIPGRKHVVNQLVKFKQEYPDIPINIMDIEKLY